MISIYILIRFVYKTWIIKQLNNHFQQARKIKLIPKNSILKWDILIETNDDFLFGTYYLHSIYIEHTSPKNTGHIDLINKSTKHPVVTDFLSSTNFAYPFVEKKKNGYFIYWKDLRFRQNKFFPYSSIIYVSPDGRQIYSVFSGWVYSIKQLRKIIKRLKRSTVEQKWTEANL